MGQHARQRFATKDLQREVVASRVGAWQGDTAVVGLDTEWKFIVKDRETKDATSIGLPPIPLG